MKIAATTAITLSWVVLLGITLASFASAELLEPRALAIVVIGAVAIAKVTIILQRFMGLAGAPIAVRAYLTGWSIVCGGVIAGLWIAAG